MFAPSAPSEINRLGTGTQPVPFLLTEDYFLKNPRNDTKRFSRAINKDSFSYLLIASPPHTGWEETDDINASHTNYTKYLF